MTNENLYDLFLNWKGLEFIHSLKSLFKWLIIALSIIFVFISVTIQNYFVLGISLVLLFLQVLSENNKEYYLKYKDLFDKVKTGGRYQTYKEWIEFLEKTKGLNSIYKWFFGLFFSRMFENEKRKS